MNKQDKVAAISKLLAEAGHAHHVVYRIVDGDHDDWASWYADWLLELSEFPEILGNKPVRSHLIHDLVDAERAFVKTKPQTSWQDFYAEFLIDSNS